MSSIMVNHITWVELLPIYYDLFIKEKAIGHFVNIKNKLINFYFASFY